MTERVDVGDKAPDFTLPRDGGESVKLSDFKGKKLVLYFYPKDDTSGCTKQAIGFTEALDDFTRRNTAILGVSKDPVKAHDKFVAKYDLKIPLGADEDLAVLQAYGVWVEKSMYGRKYMGAERTTFLIDEKGKIEKVWRKVKVKDHIADVLAAIDAL